MAADRLTPGIEAEPTVLGMDSAHVIGFARLAGKFAVMMGAKLPDGVESGQVTERAIAAMPTILAIQRGEEVDPAVTQWHVDKATELGRKLAGSSDMPAGFLNFVNIALQRASGARPEDMPAAIREALSSDEVRNQMNRVEPFLSAIEELDAGEQLRIELAAAAKHIMALAEARNKGTVIDPGVLAESIHTSVSRILEGRAPLPLLKRLLEAYMQASGKPPKLPAFEGKTKNNMTAAAPAIMVAVHAALDPADQREAEAFLSRMETSMRGDLGKLFRNKSLRAVQDDVTPLLEHLIGMLSGDPRAAREGIETLFGVAA